MQSDDVGPADVHHLHAAELRVDEQLHARRYSRWVEGLQRACDMLSQEARAELATIGDARWAFRSPDGSFPLSTSTSSRFASVRAWSGVISPTLPKLYRRWPLGVRTG
jgi:hypothetical protein